MDQPDQNTQQNKYFKNEQEQNYYYSYNKQNPSMALSNTSNYENIQNNQFKKPQQEKGKLQAPTLTLKPTYQGKQNKPIQQRKQNSQNQIKKNTSPPASKQTIQQVSPNVQKERAFTPTSQKPKQIYNDIQHQLYLEQQLHKKQQQDLLIQSKHSQLSPQQFNTQDNIPDIQVNNQSQYTNQLNQSKHSSIKKDTVSQNLENIQYQTQSPMKSIKQIGDIKTLKQQLEEIEIEKQRINYEQQQMFYQQAQNNLTQERYSLTPNNVTNVYSLDQFKSPQEIKEKKLVGYIQVQQVNQQEEPIFIQQDGLVVQNQISQQQLPLQQTYQLSSVPQFPPPPQLGSVGQSQFVYEQNKQTSNNLSYLNERTNQSNLDDKVSKLENQIDNLRLENEKLKLKMSQFSLQQVQNKQIYPLQNDQDQMEIQRLNQINQDLQKQINYHKNNPKIEKIEVLKEVPTIEYHEKIIEKEVPIEKIVEIEVIVEKPVYYEKTVQLQSPEKIKEVIKEIKVPEIQIVEKEIEVPKIVEKIIEVKVPEIQYVEKPIEVEKVVFQEVIKEVPKEKTVIKEVKVEVPVVQEKVLERVVTIENTEQIEKLQEQVEDLKRQLNQKQQIKYIQLVPKEFKQRLVAHPNLEQLQELINVELGRETNEHKLKRYIRNSQNGQLQSINSQEFSRK